MQMHVQPGGPAGPGDTAATALAPDSLLLGQSPGEGAVHLSSALGYPVNDLHGLTARPPLLNIDRVGFHCLESPQLKLSPKITTQTLGKNPNVMSIHQVMNG